MRDDPAILVVRDARRRISAEVDHDPQKLVDYYRQRQSRYGNRVVRRQSSDVHAHDDDAA